MALDQNVTSLNKGLKHVITSFWCKPNAHAPGGETAGLCTRGRTCRRGGSGSSGGGGGGGIDAVTYRHDTIESQARLLADSLFIMGD